MVGQINVPSRTLFIGDNLEILRGINSESVDLIYLDPPTNSGRMYKARESAAARGVLFSDVRTFDDMRPDWLDEIELRRPGMLHAINSGGIVHGDSMSGYLTFLGVRLIELQRVLKPSGSLYLHCDPHASHYIKIIMDALFGSKFFRNEIVWKRPPSPWGARRWRAVHDTILFYTGQRRHRWNRIFLKHPAWYWERYYKHEDERGKYQLVSLIGQGTQSGDATVEWRGVNPGDEGRHWVVPIKLLGKIYPDTVGLADLSTPEKLDLLDDAGLVHWPDNGRLPRCKIYTGMIEGSPPQDVIVDVETQRRREKTSWPTQKPEALLDLIVRASSNPGDVVLDPFCGSGTTCVVADKLDRRWVAIDSSELARTILNTRLHPTSDRTRSYWKGGLPLEVAKLPPIRTDISERATVPDPVETKAGLYARQKGKCNGCEHILPKHTLVIDRLTATARHGQHSSANLQLLCHYCKALMADNDMDHLKAQLRQRDILSHNPTIIS